MPDNGRYNVSDNDIHLRLTTVSDISINTGKIMIKVGIDIGSTTAKAIAINDEGEIVFSQYQRHNARTREVILALLNELEAKTGDVEASISITGSIGLGIAEKCGISFVQEVVAATRAIQKTHPETSTMIDIGGEDAKIVFFKDSAATDLRMNGNCAGGTGAFIDQMAIILGTDTGEMNRLAMDATRIYPMASRCGVFCKTDVQNLIAKNIRREDIAASIFHAVAVQTAITLAHGCDIKAPVLLCGGPLTFIPALRKAFKDYLSLSDSDIIIPENGAMLPATGAAMMCGTEAEGTLSQLAARIDKGLRENTRHDNALQPIFGSEREYADWQERISARHLKTADIKAGEQDVFIGIDSGSTTTKIAVTDRDGSLLYSYYSRNGGNPVKAVEQGLAGLQEKCREKGAVLNIKGSCSTGYGEDLIKAAFQLHTSIIETIAHYIAASTLDKDVSFILDIGGQDMKAIFVDNGVIDRIEINEACSSGCGSFVETFARTLGYTAHDFATAACSATAPCDLGTRCTVFMNSKVKQVLREGATVNDIAAGLSYSVIKNCLYKVLKLKDTSALGKNIVVQGGTMRNDAIVRALELLTGTEVTRCDMPELMGAVGCAIYAAAHEGSAISLDDMIQKADYTSHNLHCNGCENKCTVTAYKFGNGKKYYSGNRCEKVFTNGDCRTEAGENTYRTKYSLLFDREGCQSQPLMRIGIPRCLNMYEDYPFWHTLFTSCGMEVVLSDKSDYAAYEKCARMVMSDNICFPAKLVHAHIQDLTDKKVDRIFMPFVIFEKQGREQNSYNCPVVTGYSEVIKSTAQTGIPIDSPAINFKDRDALLHECCTYLGSLGIDKGTVVQAFAKAEAEQESFDKRMADICREVLDKSRKENRMTILLAGRPYHTDPLIQHKVADMIAGLGINVITDDIARTLADTDTSDTHFLDQWAYPNRILKAAKWCALQGRDVQFIELTSFGCGPDAFLTDEIRDMMMRYGKSMTLLKLDDINNTGSMKLRVRSLTESLKIAAGSTRPMQPFVTTPVFDKSCRRRKILAPFFTPFISPLIPSIMHVAGYDVENLPPSDPESCDWGLKYANNEICYPATLIVGDIIKAFKSGRYKPEETAVAITQTGGQCRASNYISLIKKALTDAGYSNVPVMSLTFGSSIKNEQPGFKVNWLKMLPIALNAVLFSDCIAKFYYAAKAREKEAGSAVQLKDKYLAEAARLIHDGRWKELPQCLARAAEEFDGICTDTQCPKVGIVGEIYLKFNRFSQKDLTEWLSRQNIEIVPPILTDFFMQSFVNRKVWKKSGIEKSRMPEFVYDSIYKLVKKQIDKTNAIAGRFRYFTPFADIFDEAEKARKIITLNAQFGEGWLLPAEIMSYAENGTNNVISLQPFGCIANHIVSKGIEKRIKYFYPDMNLLSLDFDSGVSDVNITNRALLFIDTVKRQQLKS